MTARTHEVAGALVFVAATVVWPPESISTATAIGALLACQAGAMAPDIDQPTAPLWRAIPVGRLLGKLFKVLVGGHRFLLHSLIGMALFGVLAYAALTFFEPILPEFDKTFVLMAFLLGVASHIVADGLTKEGVPLLLPLPVKFGFPPLRSTRLTTGKTVEKFILFPLLTAVLAWLILANHNEIIALFK